MQQETYFACSSDLNFLGILTLKYFMIPSKSWDRSSFLTIMRRASDTWNMVSVPWSMNTSRTRNTRNRGNLAEKRVRNHWEANM